MTDLPQAAIDAAAEAIAWRFDAWTTREASDVIFTVLAAAAPHIAAAERERIAQVGAAPLVGRCAYEAFAMATRDSLNLPSWEHIPAETRIEWQMTADAVLLLATTTPTEGDPR